MTTNPDDKIYIGLGPQTKQKDSQGEDMSMDSRYLIPTQGMLRFVERAEHNETNEFVRNIRILQQYQWTQEEGDFDWYDIPLVIE